MKNILEVHTLLIKLKMDKFLCLKMIHLIIVLMYMVPIASMVKGAELNFQGVLIMI